LVINRDADDAAFEVAAAPRCAPAPTAPARLRAPARAWSSGD